MKDEKTIKYGFGESQSRCYGFAFDSVEELLEFAQASWDNEDGDPFDDEKHDAIYIGTAETFDVAEFAPSLDEIADQITDSFYSEHNIDECEDAQIVHRKEAEAAWKEFVNKYFELPGGCTITTTWNIGVYDLREHKWIERYEKDTAQ